MKWELMKTAPKTGHEILVCNVNQGSIIQLIRWNRIHEYWEHRGEPDIFPQWTHWTAVKNIPKRQR